ncbi:uncharacterized protein [Triticum aestivum]|uniref:uncharacterized protein n=1 Tax=Triticum aestivum TaxID=4565 RepID=UPI001D032884|nr:uncharacterized protein LOC123120929 [Triticum aestivum]
MFDIIRSPSLDENEEDDGSQYLHNTGEGMIFDEDERIDEVHNNDDEGYILQLTKTGEPSRSRKSSTSSRAVRGPAKKLQAGVKYNVDAIKRNGEPLEPKKNANKFIRQCGVIVRDQIPISVQECKKAAKGDPDVTFVSIRAKDLLWESLMSPFTLPDRLTDADLEKVKKSALKKMAITFNNYKKNIWAAYVKAGKQTPEFKGTLEKGGGRGYYPGSHKDANCAYEICPASINATRGLLPPEAACVHCYFAAAARDWRSGMRSLFLARNGSATPGSAVTESWTPPLRSTTKTRRPWRESAAARARRSSSLDWALYVLTVLGFLRIMLLLWVDTGLIPEVVARGFGPKLSSDAVARLGQEACLAPAGLGHKLRSLERGVGQLIGADRISNCSSKDSVWRLQQNDQHLFHWRCSLYKSAAEEVSIWGSPLRSSGLLPSTLLTRHITILSGKLTEWSDGSVLPMVSASNGSSWSYRGWSAAAVLLEPEVWVLEYQRSVLFEGTRLLPATVELLASRCSEMAKRSVYMRECLLPVHGQEHVHIYEMHSQIVDMRECLLPVVTEGLSHQQSSGGKRHKK